VPEGGEDPVRGSSQILCWTLVSYLKNVFKDAMPEGGDTSGGGAEGQSDGCWTTGVSMTKLVALGDSQGRLWYVSVWYVMAEEVVLFAFPSLLRASGGHDKGEVESAARIALKLPRDL